MERINEMENYYQNKDIENLAAIIDGMFNSFNAIIGIEDEKIGHKGYKASPQIAIARVGQELGQVAENLIMEIRGRLIGRTSEDN